MKLSIDITDEMYQAVKNGTWCGNKLWYNALKNGIPQETFTEFADRCRECGKIKRCKDCKYFEYNSVAKVDGIPLIVAHEICSKWGDGCKTSEDGYCFLFEPKEEGIYAHSYPPCRYRADIPDFYRK